MNRTTWLQDRRMQKFRDVLSRGYTFVKTALHTAGLVERARRRGASDERVLAKVREQAYPRRRHDEGCRCEEAGGVSSPDHLLAYLHNAGIVFYQAGLFSDHVVLDQAWR